jgi:hypothetical protein
MSAKSNANRPIRSRCPHCTNFEDEGSHHNCAAGKSKEVWVNPNAGNPGRDWSKKLEGK